MIPLGVTKKLRDDGPGRLILVTSPRRRVLSFILFIMLVTAMIIGIDPATDFNGKRVIGTLFFLCLTAGTLLSASYSWKMICDRAEKSVIIGRYIFSFTFTSKSYPFSEIRQVMYRKVNLLKGGDIADGRKGSMIGSEQDTARLNPQGFLTVRSRQITNLYLQLENDNLLLDSSTDTETLQAYGMRLAELLSVPFVCKE